MKMSRARYLRLEYKSHFIPSNKHIALFSWQKNIKDFNVNNKKPELKNSDPVYIFS